MNITTVIKKAHITEKTTKDSESGKYTFVVDIKADKNQIRNAINKAFKVDVVSVETTLIKGRTKRVGVRRNETKQPVFKKATIRLKKGQTLGQATEKEEIKSKSKKK